MYVFSHLQNQDLKTNKKNMNIKAGLFGGTSCRRRGEKRGEEYYGNTLHVHIEGS
jgi:hypothetical protein